MFKRVASYAVYDHAPQWVDQIKLKIPSAIGKYGMVSVTADSDDDKYVQSVLERLGYSYRRQTLLTASGKDLLAQPFHYFRIQADREYRGSEYMDSSAICGGDENTLCRLGVQQKEKILVDPARSKRADILEDDAWQRPNIVFVKRRLKESLEAIGATGCSFVPCLTPDSLGDERVRSFSEHSPSLESIATHFQVVISARVRSPQRIGELYRISQRCSKCGAVYTWASSEYGYFLENDIDPHDFQILDRKVADDGTEFPSASDVIIVSARVLRLFLKEKVKGLCRYLVDPPIKYGIVDVRKPGEAENGGT